jgi:pullulanase/glycogen debranching enzyme
VLEGDMAAATETFDWAGDVRPLWTRNEAVLYHLHPHAFTAHPSCPVSDPAVRGTFKGVEENLPYLVRPLPGGVDRMGVVRLVRAKRLKRRRIKRASGGWVLNCLNCLNFGRRGWRNRVLTGSDCPGGAHQETLGVNTVVLDPVAAFVDIPESPDYLGRAPASLMAPHAAFASTPGAAPRELKSLVRTATLTQTGLVDISTCGGAE